MLLLLLWLIIEVTEALEELKKLLQTINNSKYASCNSYSYNYCNIINMLLSDQTGTGRGSGRGRGRGRGRGQGVDVDGAWMRKGEIY